MSVTVTSCSLFLKFILSLYLCDLAKIRVSHKLEHTHAKATHRLVEEISEKERELGQEVTRVSSIATGMERCVPRCEASQDKAKLRAAGPFCASWPVNTEDCVHREEGEGGERKE